MVALIVAALNVPPVQMKEFVVELLLAPTNAYDPLMTRVPPPRVTVFVPVDVLAVSWPILRFPPKVICPAFNVRVFTTFDAVALSPRLIA